MLTTSFQRGQQHPRVLRSEHGLHHISAPMLVSGNGTFEFHCRYLEQFSVDQAGFDVGDDRKTW
jgi:hypothetical protein